MTTQGAFVWYELMTTDTAAAAKFYGQVVGWNAEHTPMPGMDYTLFKVGETRVAGLMTLMSDAVDRGIPPNWTGYIAVDDVDAMAAAYQADGGAILHAPDDIPNIGRFAVVADPQGAVVCLFKGQGEMPAPLPAGAPGTIGWHELMTSDLDAGFAFYAKRFGWTKGETMPMGEMGAYQLFAHDGVDIGGMMRRPPHVPVSYWGYYFNVPKIDVAVQAVVNGGGQILHGPAPVPGGMQIAQCRDPQGAFFAVVGPQ